MKKDNYKIDPMKGVVKPETLLENIRAAVAGNAKSMSYIRGSLQYLERNPPNPFVVPLLRKALNKAKGVPC